MTSKEWNEVIREDARRGKYDPTWMYVNNVVADLAAAEAREAALREALEKLRPQVTPPYEWEPDPERYNAIIDAALATVKEGKV